MGAQSVAQTSPGTGLQDGTPVRIRINRNVSSADARVGDTVDFEVLDEIKIGDVVIIPKGGIALGTVTEAVPKRRMGKGGKLNVNIDHVKLINGEKVPLRAVKETSGGGHTGAMTGAIVATSIVFFPAAPLFLFIHGKDITIPKGTEITAYVNGDFAIATKSQATQATGSVSQPATVGADTAILVVNSVPDGSDITIDGKYAGNAPSTLRLTPGDHTMLIGKSEFKPWQRTVSISAGSSVTIAATLEKNSPQ